MQLNTIAIHSPGDMGQAVGRVLSAHGLRVVAALEGRSKRTSELAAAAGIENVGSLGALVREAQMVLSILVPAQALSAAEDAAAAMKAEGAFPLYVDCNAIAADTSVRVGERIQAAGGRYVDASIIGPPPRKPGVTRFYASGEPTAEFAALGDFGLDVRVLDGPPGQASAFKTCYAALTKGLTALGAGVMVAARTRGLHESLAAEFQASQPALYAWLERAVPRMPPKAHRFVGEMEEHALGFAALGLTPKMMEGAADIYRLAAASPIGREAPEEAPARTLEEVATLLAQALKTG